MVRKGTLGKVPGKHAFHSAPMILAFGSLSICIRSHDHPRDSSDHEPHLKGGWRMKKERMQKKKKRRREGDEEKRMKRRREEEEKTRSRSEDEDEEEEEEED